MNTLKLLLIWIICTLAAVFGLLRMLYATFTNQSRAWLLAVSFDRLANAAVNGSLNETISTRAHRASTEGRRWGCVLCVLLDRLDKNHCANALALESKL